MENMIEQIFIEMKHDILADGEDESSLDNQWNWLDTERTRLANLGGHLTPKLFLRARILMEMIRVIEELETRQTV